MIKIFNDSTFHKDYEKYTGDLPTPLMPQEMERIVTELPRDAETVELFKKAQCRRPAPRAVTSKRRTIFAAAVLLTPNP